MDGYVTIGTNLDTKTFDKEIAALENKLNDIEASLQMGREDKTLFSTREMKEMEAEAEKLSNRLVDLKKKQADAGKIDYSGIQSSISNIGNSMEGIIKKTIRWGLAVFGIRSMYLFVRQAMSTLTQYDDQMATNVEYIRYLLASTLKPVIEYIINLAYKLLAYINYIAQAWFGVNLFANATTKAFQKQNKALGGSVKKAKELQKTLAGFDEMNILQENGDVGSGGGGGGVGDIGKLPSFPKIEDVPIPGWLQWIVDNKDIVIAGLLGIAGALTALQLGASGLMALGIGIAIAGVAYTIMSILNYLKDPSWSNFGKIITGIGITLVGIGVAIGGLPLIIAGAVGIIVGLVISNWEKIHDVLQKGIDWLASKSDWIRDHFGIVGQTVYDFFIRTLQRILDYFNTVFTSIKGIFDGIIKFVKGVFTGNWKQAWEGVKQIFYNVFNLILGRFTLIFGQIKDKVVTWSKTVGDVIGGAFKAVVNGVLNAVEKILNKPIKAINSLIDTINEVPGINISKLDTFNLPRLAKGGIVNMPGRGVPIGGAITGERGAEGVIPLTDSQQMALLGEAIGKYITINANITNTMNGRVISRELQKINNESDFAFNK